MAHHKLKMFVFLLLLSMASSRGQEEAAPVQGQEEPAVSAKPPTPASIAVAEVKARLQRADGGAISTFKATYPDKFPAVITLESAQQLEIKFDPRVSGAASAKLQQAFLSVQPVQGGPVAYLVARSKKDQKGLTVTLSASLLDRQLGKREGQSYRLALLLGDPSVPLGLRYDLGDVDVESSTSSKGEVLGQPLLTARVQPDSNLQPIITHLHRLPEKRPPAAVSLAFAALAFAPLLAALAALVLGKIANFKGFPTGAGALWALLFHLSLGGLLVLYLVFWLRLDLARTLPLVGVLAVVIGVTGYNALSAVAEQRLKKQ